MVMVQEYADGGDLFTLLQKYGGRLGEKVAVQMVLDPVLRVLQYLHTRSIVHRDIKPGEPRFGLPRMLRCHQPGGACKPHVSTVPVHTRLGAVPYARLRTPRTLRSTPLNPACRMARPAPLALPLFQRTSCSRRATCA